MTRTVSQGKINAQKKKGVFMRKIILYIFILSFISFLPVVSASASTGTEVSFIQYSPEGDTLKGVDGSTASWSSSDTMVDLGTQTWSLLGAMASVTSFGGNLTHRGTRGLGVSKGEQDEVDSYGCAPERIEIQFTKAYALYYLEVRSLFYEPSLWNPGTEEGSVDFYLNNTKFYNEHLTGVQDISQGTKGIVSASYSLPKVIDKLVFYVPQGQSYTSQSEFAVAKLNVTVTPEPVSSGLFLLGGALTVARNIRRKKA